MSPLDSKNDIRVINDDFRKAIDTYKDDTSDPKKVIIEFRNDLTEKLARPVHQIPIELIRLRRNNGRIASDVLAYESKHGRIKESTDEGQKIIRGFINKKHSSEDKTLYQSLIQYGQREHAIITCDGYLINGNRRKMTMDRLHLEYPNDTRFAYMRAVILPGSGQQGGAPTIKEIEQLENRLQLMKTGKAEYKGFDGALSIRRKIDLGISIEEQLLDNPEHFSKSPARLRSEVKKVENTSINPLKCIDRYLLHFDRPDAYDLIGDRWQAFVDYSNFYYNYLKNERKRMVYFDGNVDEIDIPVIEDIAFKILRKRRFNSENLSDKLHMLMRQLRDIYKDKDARKEIEKIHTDIPIDIDQDKIEELDDPNSIKERDREWSRDTEQNFNKIIINAKKLILKSREKETAMSLMTAITGKLNKLNGKTILDGMNQNEIKKHFSSLRKIQEKVDEIVGSWDHKRQ